LNGLVKRCKGQGEPVGELEIACFMNRQRKAIGYAQRRRPGIGVGISVDRDGNKASSAIEASR
jgi:hypothetical protein